MISAREAALKALVEIEKESMYANLVLPGYLKNVSPKSRAFTRSIVYGTVRHQNTLDWSISLYLKHPLGDLTPFIRNLLRSAAYQVIYLDNIPPQVTVDESVKLAYRYGHKGVAGLVNAVMRRIVSRGKDLPWPHKDKEKERFLSLYYSIPEWLVRRWINRMGYSDTMELCRSLNEIPAVSIRANLLKTKREDLMSRLHSEGIETEAAESLPEALTVSVNNSKSIPLLSSYTEGLFTLQGESSMIAGRVMNPLPEKTVLDLCSAPGGKTTHLAELMEDRGEITARDINPRRIKLVQDQAKRLGLKIIKTEVGDATVKESYKKPADYILVDAPCSGLGVLNRKPDLKWRKSEGHIMQLSRLQKKIMGAASDALKSGGLLLYCVCTNEPEETVEVVGDFLRNHPGFTPLSADEYESYGKHYLTKNRKGPDYLEILPHIHGKDGFFISAFRKNKA